MNVRTTLLLLALALSASASAVHAAPQPTERQIGSLSLRHPFARATVPGQNTTAVYLEIDNHGKQADRLLRVSSPAAAAAEMHSMAMQDGVMRMRELDQIALPAGKTTLLMPSQGFHLMLQRLRSPLVAGQQIALRLRFAHAGTVVLQVPVEAIGATAATAANSASPASTGPVAAPIPPTRAKSP